MTWMARSAIVVIGASATCAGLARADEPWIGRWAIDPRGCAIYGDTASTSPLIVTERTLNWFAASCRIGKIYRTGDAVHIQAHCSNEGKARTIPVSLMPRGDRLAVVWDNARAGEMRRCR